MVARERKKGRLCKVKHTGNQQCGPQGRNKHSTRQNDETRIQKKLRGLGTSGTSLNVPTSEL